MILLYSGIDWETAALDRRARFGLADEEIQALVSRFCGVPGVSGCVLLSTCNRTELYLTADNECPHDPVSLLCGELGLPFDENSPYFRRLKGAAAARHLMEVACGLRSRVLGEDQILTQVGAALHGAREAKSADSVLQTLFRIAVTAGKEVKSKVRLGGASASAAERAVEQMAEAAGSLAGKRAVVIGNGEMGRLAAALLVEKGCRVTVTLRSYRHGQTIVPHGCDTAPYDRRLEAIEGCDLLVSATKSPHCTITAEQIRQLECPPKFVADLAVPRDVEEAVGQLSGIRLWDIDAIGDTGGDTESRREAMAIIDTHIAAFYRWWNRRNALVREDNAVWKPL